MAISRHSDEWKQTIATAALAGVHFQQVAAVRYYGRWNGDYPFWLATVGDFEIRAGSKIEAARKALHYLGQDRG